MGNNPVSVNTLFFLYKIHKAVFLKDILFVVFHKLFKPSMLYIKVTHCPEVCTVFQFDGWMQYCSNLCRNMNIYNSIACNLEFYSPVC